VRILIIGARGQLGQALYRRLQRTHVLVGPDHDELDISDWGARARITALRPELVLLTAAYTDVDGCATNPDQAFRSNTLGPKHVALACAELDIPLVYVSTNEVFDGAGSHPYREYDQPRPINAYGASKWGGEQAVLQHLRRFYIVRVAWLFGGPRNFVRTVLRLADERPELRMVQDEVGSPTYAADVAEALEQLIETGCYGIYHFVNAGACSRYELAQEILRLAGKQDYPLHPITLAEFERPSTPPAHTPLLNLAGASLGIELRSWRDALADYMRELGAGGPGVSSGY
jgi:dTDP-4-dehydrorhamnose reductase